MWQSTCASSVVTRPEKMYQATPAATRITTRAIFTGAPKFSNRWRSDSDFCGVAGGAAAPAASAAGCGGGVGGVELMIRLPFYFEYMASISPVARARAARARLN